MGEDLDPLITEEPQRPNARALMLTMVGVTVVMALAGLLLMNPRFAFGILFGGGLSFINFVWLDRSTKAIFRQGAASSATILALKYVLRYVVIGLIVWAVYATGAFPIVAVIAGLSAFALAVVSQGLKSIFTSSI